MAQQDRHLIMQDYGIINTGYIDGIRSPSRAIGSLPSFEDGNERKMDFSFIPLSVSMKSFPRGE